VREDVALAAGFSLAGLGTLGTTVLLVPVRDHPVGPTLAVAALVLVVATSTALGGPAAGAMGTLTAVLSFDFLFVPPYLDLKAGHAADRWPIIALIIVGSGIVIAARRRAATVPRALSPVGPNPSRHVDRVARLIEQRTDPRDLVLAVEAELTALLAARRCRFEPGEASAARPRLERSGSVIGHGDEPALPPVEVELPVLAGTHRIGCFVIDPTPDALVPIAHRITALILADHLGRALAARKSSSPTPPT
jgi:hypothetical protein